MKICLTFDDGFSSHYSIARPLLNKHGLKATFFICGSLFVTNDLKYMTTGQIQQLYAEGFEIGSHFYHHKNFDESNSSTQFRKVNEAFTRNRIPLPSTFAYPGFHVSIKSVKKLIKQNQYKFARAGCEKTLEFDLFQEGGQGSLFDVLYDSPYNVNCAGVFGEKFTFQDLKKWFKSMHLEDMKSDKVAVFCFHDIEKKTSGTTLSVDDFQKCLRLFKKTTLESIRFQDLGKVD
jgi:hypothetical protein